MQCKERTSDVLALGQVLARPLGGLELLPAPWAALVPGVWSLHPSKAPPSYRPHCNSQLLPRSLAIKEVGSERGAPQRTGGGGSSGSNLAEPEAASPRPSGSLAVPPGREEAHQADVRCWQNEFQSQSAPRTASEVAG